MVIQPELLANGMQDFLMGIGLSKEDLTTVGGGLVVLPCIIQTRRIMKKLPIKTNTATMKLINLSPESIIGSVILLLQVFLKMGNWWMKRNTRLLPLQEKQLIL